MKIELRQQPMYWIYDRLKSQSNQLGDQLRNQFYDQLRNRLNNQLRGQLRDWGYG